MPGTIGLIRGIIMHGSGQTPMGLVVGNNGVPVKQADLTAISYQVIRFEVDGTRTTTGQGTLALAAVIYDTPVTNDPRYTLSGGYNFAAVIPATCFQTEGLFHRIDITFTPVSGQPWVQEWGGVTQ